MKTPSFVRKLKQLVKKPLFKYSNKEVPKRGCFPVDIVGEAEAGEAIRYEVSVGFLKTTCFKKLLEEYEEEIRWQGSGAIKLPCSVHKFEEAVYKDRINSRLINN